MATRFNSSLVHSATLFLGSVGQRLWLILFTLAALFLLIWQLVMPQTSAHIRAKTLDIVTPVITVFSAPVRYTRSSIESVKSNRALRSELSRLKAEIEELRYWRGAALSVENQNDQLREILGVTDSWQYNYKTVRLIADQGTAYAQSAIIGYGRARGAQVGQALMSHQGLLGRLVDIGEHSSRVMLINDVSSRVPVYIQRLQKGAILIGNNQDKLELKALTQSLRLVLQKGDKLFTSGQGDIYPPGLPVGVIEDINESGIYVRPYANWRDLNYIQVIEYRKPKWLFDE